MEVFKATIASKSIDPELVQISTDSNDQNVLQTYKDLQTLGQTMFEEAEVTVSAGLPDSDALLGYSKIVSDLLTLGALKEIMIAFLGYVASKMPSTYTGTTPAYLTSGPLGTGNSQGIVNSSDASLLNGISPTDVDNATNALHSLSFSGALDAGSPLDPDNADFNPFTSDSAYATASDGDEISGTIGSIAASTDDGDGGDGDQGDG